MCSITASLFFIQNMQERSSLLGKVLPIELLS